MKEFTYMAIFGLSLLLILQGVDEMNFTFWVGLGIFTLDCLLMKDNDNGKNDGKTNAA